MIGLLKSAHAPTSTMIFVDEPTRCLRIGRDAQILAASPFMNMKALRLRRLFGADGRMLLVAMDHARLHRPQQKASICRR